MKKSFALIFCLFLMLVTSGQIPVGKFRSHIPLHAFHSVAIADDYAYAATDNGLLLVELASMDSKKPDISSWSKADGLSDIDISKIYYDKPHKTLIICYQDGNIDIIKEDKLYNINDIKNKSLSGSKEPSHIRVCGNTAYITYPFGIVLFNLDDLLIDDTWFTKRDGKQYNVTDIALTDTHFYISTTEGIFFTNKNHFNLANFQEWQQDSGAGNDEYDNILFFGEHLFANKNTHNLDIYPVINDTLFILDQNTWKPFATQYADVRSLTANESQMVISDWCLVEAFTPELVSTNTLYWFQSSGYPDSWEAVADGKFIWIADNEYGLVRVKPSDKTVKVFTDDGPFATSAESFCCQNGIVAVVPGTHRVSIYAPQYQKAALSWLHNQHWEYSTEFMTYDTAYLTHDLTNVIINPNKESEWYVASWGNGLFKCENQKIVQHFNAGNSPLEASSYGQTFVSGLAYDQKGNLWMTNSQCNNMLKMLEPDGTWHEYNITRGIITSSNEGVVADNLLIDSRNYKWVNFPREDNFTRAHLVVFSESNTYDNPGDDKFITINMNAASEVNSSTVYCMAEDLDGEIWIGTDKGIKVINFPDKVFDGNVYPKNILLEQDGYVSVLFEFEEITAIAVDGANRKWIGTKKGGVFLMSEDGTEQLLHFTAEDHPLFSNQITSIGIDPLSGEVFFGSLKGIVGYRGTATEGFESYEDLTVFPNPVRHGYDGQVAVYGLKANSLCKITDASGRLVWQGYSHGGSLIWNCLDHFGHRPATGVYYVMASDENGKEKVVTKFLFIH